MREHVKILPSVMMRDERTERRVVELNRERFVFGMLLFGGLILLLAVIW